MPTPSYQNSASRYNNNSSRWVGIVFVVILHVGVIYALLYALGTKAIEVLRGPIQVSDIKEDKPKDETVPPPPPKVDTPPPAYVPPVEVNIMSAAPATTAITQTSNTKAPPPPPPAPPAPKETTAPVPLKTTEQPAYPALSRRLEEEGTVIIAVLVGADGGVTDAKVETSTGFPRLDAAALDFAKTRKYRPGMADGNPVAAWYRYKYRFLLN